MFCPKCGNQISDGESFCSKCGNPIRTENNEKKCPGCGENLKDGEGFCPNCGTSLQNNASQRPNTAPSGAQTGKSFWDVLNERKKCLPAFIIGLIGSILGIFGGLCVTMCSCGRASNSAFLLIFGGAVVAMIGSCLCLNKAKLGAPIQLVGAIMIIIRAYSGGADFMTVFSFVLLLVAGIIGVISAYFSDITKLFNKK